jgi:A/G-specific adenine glycosylase
MEKKNFQRIIWEFYRNQGRDLPWRREPCDPYHILVSEIMLQQTQVKRVIPKYRAFLELFPTIDSLAKAPLSKVLQAWNGLGYNRRAKYVHDAAKQLHGIAQPWKREDLIACKGIGHNTASAILTYAYNQPVAFVETNIRTVLLHHFGVGLTSVSDKKILHRMEATMDKNRPREWCWALMDYGTHLKQQVGNMTRMSKHYRPQSTFAGSRRQLRGQVIKILAAQSVPLSELQQTLQDERLSVVLHDLCREELITKYNNYYVLAA